MLVLVVKMIALISDFFPTSLFVTSQNLLMYSSVLLQCGRGKRRNEKLFMSLFVHNDVDRPSLLLLESQSWFCPSHLVMSPKHVSGSFCSDSNLFFVIAVRYIICNQKFLISLGKVLLGTKVMDGCMLNLTQDHLKLPSV